MKLSVEELKKVVSDPARLAEANALLNGSVEPVEPASIETPPTPEEVAVQAEADRVAAETARIEAEKVAQAEAAKAAAKVAEEEAYKAAGVTVLTDADGNITKIIKTYQARDEAGSPIGRPTYLEAKTWVELSVKQQNAHENAVRFAERLKKQKVTVKKDEPQVVQTLSEQELLQLQEDLKSEDHEKAAKAADKVRLNNEAKRLAAADKAIEDARQAQESYKFLVNHVQDFNRCEANIKLLSDYIDEHNLVWTAENLEAAFLATELQQAPKEPVVVEPAPKEPVVPSAPANPAPVAPAPVAPPPAPVATPAPPAAPNPPAPPAPRPGVNGSLVPGAQSAPRPTGQPQGLTKADIKKMSREEYKRRLKDPKFVAEVNALLAKK